MGDSTTLITVTGTDRPGITAALFSLLAEDEQIRVLDLQQVVIRGKLTLGTVISAPRQPTLLLKRRYLSPHAPTLFWRFARDLIAVLLAI